MAAKTTVRIGVDPKRLSMIWSLCGIPPSLANENIMRELLVYKQSATNVCSKKAVRTILKKPECQTQRKTIVIKTRLIENVSETHMK